jgi:tetratricopeptide (TPR) repeat protein
LFFEGRINEALEILSEERLKRQTAEVKKQQEDVVRNWLLHGQMLAVKFDFDGAARTYKEAVEFSPGSFDAWFAYAFFHQGQNHFKEGRQGYEKALVLARASGKDEEVQRPSTTWASCTGMRTAWRKREQLMRRRWKSAASWRSRIRTPTYLVALPLYNLGLLYNEEKRMAEARADFEESLKIRRKLAQQNPDVYLPKVAATLYNLGILHRGGNRMVEARTAFEESLKIYRALEKAAPVAYEPYVRIVQDNLDELP